MTKYVVKRVISAILTVFLISIITFFLMNLVPGGPFNSEKAVTPAAKAAMEKKYGLDQPVIVQYKNYMTNLLQGDMGVSLKQKGRTINSIVERSFPVSAKLGSLAVVVALLLGVPMGALAAMKRGKLADGILRVLSTLGIAIPSFVLATFLMMSFSGILPTRGLNTPDSYILPVFALAFYPMCYIARLMRSSMLDVLGQDYIRTARAKGVKGVFILFKHALRNAILPVITYLGPLFAYTLTGSFVVEKIFNIPGIGLEFISAITVKDYPMIMTVTIILASLLVIMNMVVDILYKVIDPRIKLK